MRLEHVYYRKNLNFDYKLDAVFKDANCKIHPGAKIDIFARINEFFFSFAEQKFFSFFFLVHLLQLPRNLTKVGIWIWWKPDFQKLFNTLKEIGVDII